MKEQLISFDTAVLIESTELNSWEYSHAAYCKVMHRIVNPDVLKQEDKIYAPTQSLVQKWLREKHNIHIDMYRSALGFQCNLDKAGCGTHICKVVEDEEFTYEQALEAGLKEALKRIP